MYTIDIYDTQHCNDYNAEFQIFNRFGTFKFSIERNYINMYDFVAYLDEGGAYNLTNTEINGLEYWLKEMLDERGIGYDDGSGRGEWDEHWTCGL
jgi:hypothetical protein